jgi:GNAT superfamily N-acetyltransferase
VSLALQSSALNSGRARYARVVKAQPISNQFGHERLVEIHNAVIVDDPVDVDDHLGYLRSTREHEEFLVFDGNRAVGAAFVAIEPVREIPYAQLWVEPDARGRGAGSALYEAVSRWASERDATRLEVPVREDDPDSLGFARRRGFIEDKREAGLMLDLAAIEPLSAEPPEGVEIISWAERPELARGIYEVVQDALPDIPGEGDYVVESFEGWLEHDMRGPGDRPEATFVALTGDDVIGYAKFSLTDAQPTTAHHDLTGVKRAWRRRGVAKALKAAQIRWAKENGFEQLRTRNEERNEPIRRLNERFGYRPAPGRIYLRGPLADPSAGS